MAAITICSDFGAPPNKTAGFSSYDGEFRMPLVLAQGSPNKLLLDEINWVLVNKFK